MRYDITLMWSDEKPPGPGIFEDLRKAGARDILRNGSIKSGGLVYFTTYATLNHPPAAALAFSETLYQKYDLEVVELTWNPPDFMWSISNWCLEHNFRSVVDAFNNLIETVSARYLRP